MSALAEAEAILTARLEELQAAVDEHATITATLTAMRGKKPAKAVGRRSAKAGPSGERAKQALELLQRRPDGLSVSALANFMGVHANYIYTVVNGLEAAGKARKVNGVWFATDPTEGPSA